MNLLFQVIPQQTSPVRAGRRRDGARWPLRGPGARPPFRALGISRLASLSRLLSAASRANLNFAGLPLAPSRSATALGNRLHCSPRLQHTTFRGGANKEISGQPRRQNVASPDARPTSPFTPPGEPSERARASENLHPTRSFKETPACAQNRRPLRSCRTRRPSRALRFRMKEFRRSPGRDLAALLPNLRKVPIPVYPRQKRAGTMRLRPYAARYGAAFSLPARKALERVSTISESEVNPRCLKRSSLRGSW